MTSDFENTSAQDNPSGSAEHPVDERYDEQYEEQYIDNHYGVPAPAADADALLSWPAPTLSQPPPPIEAEGNGFDITGYDPSLDWQANGSEFGHGQDCNCGEHAANPSAVIGTNFVTDTDGFIADPDRFDAELGFAENESGDESANAGIKGLASDLSRRKFLRGVAAGGAVIAGGAIVKQVLNRSESIGTKDSEQALSESTGDTEVPTLNITSEIGDGKEVEATGQAQALAAPFDQRILVVIQLQGGNDGLSTVIPRNSSELKTLRPRLAIPEPQIIPIDADIGFNPALVNLSKGNFSVVEGIGAVAPVFSHFEMEKRWEVGDVKGNSGQRKGFLGALAAATPGASDVKFAGLSLDGNTPFFSNADAAPLYLSSVNDLRPLINEDYFWSEFRRRVTQFGGGPTSAKVSSDWRELISLGSAFENKLEVDNEQPMYKDGGKLGKQLALAAEVIKANIGVKVIHASLGGFDTHDGHAYKQERNLKQFDVAVSGFLAQMEAAGLADRVLVATVSEFGRRVKENGSGLDHGAGSSMMMFGPVSAKRLGEHVPPTKTDDKGNLLMAVPFDRYLATLTQEWLGVEAASLLPDNPQPLGLR